jgi:hypothetical protein
MKRQLFSLAFSALSLIGLGQTVRITNDCSCIGLESDVKFDEIVSSLVFTVSWPEGESFEWESTHSAVRVMPSGRETSTGGRRFLTFSAVGLTLLRDVGAAISPRKSLCVLNHQGKDVRIEARGPAVNTDYYVALNGRDATGRVLNSNCKEEVRVIIFPNPTQEEITVSILKGRFSRVDIVSQLGVTVYSSIVVQERMRIRVDGLVNGPYTVRLSGEDQYSGKIIIQK